MYEVHHALSRKQAIKQPDGKFTSPYPGSLTGEVLSIQPDGKVDKRPKGTAGPWEVWRDDGTKAVFEVEGRMFAILLVD